MLYKRESNFSFASNYPSEWMANGCVLRIVVGRMQCGLGAKGNYENPKDQGRSRVENDFPEKGNSLKEHACVHR